eukprot:TRINITY_DN9240_c0_g1_i1.p1 TRINITY_DN9240_c0_g1~~TRINITY_DN9240_c0_g1_i1.p1  ORF type:complete len:820 (+),score=149.42 TRINITY_DN9240_c0_g1_i1:85-2544(+)
MSEGRSRLRELREASRPVPSLAVINAPFGLEGDLNTAASTTRGFSANAKASAAGDRRAASARGAGGNAPRRRALVVPGSPRPLPASAEPAGSAVLPSPRELQQQTPGALTRTASAPATPNLPSAPASTTTPRPRLQYGRSATEAPEGKAPPGGDGELGRTQSQPSSASRGRPPLPARPQESLTELSRIRPSMLEAAGADGVERPSYSSAPTTPRKESGARVASAAQGRPATAPQLVSTVWSMAAPGLAAQAKTAPSPSDWYSESGKYYDNFKVPRGLLKHWSVQPASTAEEKRLPQRNLSGVQWGWTWLDAAQRRALQEAGQLGLDFEERRLSDASRAAIEKDKEDMTRRRLKQDAETDFQRKRPWGKKHYPSVPGEVTTDKLIWHREHRGDFEDRDWCHQVKRELLDSRAGLDSRVSHLRRPKSPEVGCNSDAAGMKTAENGFFNSQLSTMPTGLAHDVRADTEASFKAVSMKYHKLRDEAGSLIWCQSGDDYDKYSASARMGAADKFPGFFKDKFRSGAGSPTWQKPPTPCKMAGCFSPLGAWDSEMDDAAGQGIPERVTKKKAIDLGSNVFECMRGEFVQSDKSTSAYKDDFRGFVGRGSWEQPTDERYHNAPTTEVNVWGCPVLPKGYGHGQGKKRMEHLPKTLSEVHKPVPKHEIPVIVEANARIYRNSAGRATWRALPRNKRVWQRKWPKEIYELVEGVEEPWSLPEPINGPRIDRSISVPAPKTRKQSQPDTTITRPPDILERTAGQRKRADGKPGEKSATAKGPTSQKAMVRSSSAPGGRASRQPSAARPRQSPAHARMTRSRDRRERAVN